MTYGTSARMHRRRSAAISLNRALYRASQTWLAWFFLFTGLWVGLPWLAPVFMELGWTGPAELIYKFYALQCHQLPQRSFFLYSPEKMYSLEFIQATWDDTSDPAILRQFVGSSHLGYKVAWSDRMVSAYTSIPLSALLWRLLRRGRWSLPIRGFVLLALLMAIDGGTHLISDLSGLGQGFRYSNAWLAELTGNSLPASFYSGNALGSFNSWMRLISGVLFGIGLVWFAIPYIQAEFTAIARNIESEFSQAGVKL